MPAISPRLTVSLSMLALLAVIGWPRTALGNHHHIGGGSSSGSSGSDDDADCLVWGYVIADGGTADGSDGAIGDANAAADADTADPDASADDAGNAADAAQPADAGTGDGVSTAPPGAVLVCLEHAKLFGCDCATGPPVGSGWSVDAVATFAAIGAMLMGRRRQRRRRRRPDVGAGDNR